MQPKHRKLNNLKFLNTFNAKNQNALKLKALSKKNRIYLKANTRGVLNNFNYLKPRLTLYLFSILYVKSLKTSLKAKKHITLINYFYPSLNSFFKNS
jgi:hypothetical protein